MGIAHNGNERPERDYHNYILIAAGLAFLLFALWDRGPERETTGSASSLGSVIGTASQRAPAQPTPGPSPAR